MFQRKYDLDIYNTYTTANIWQQYVQAGQKTGLGQEVYFELRYEDLLEDPVASMKKICKFLGEEYNDSQINFKKSTDKKSKTHFSQSLRSEIMLGNGEAE